MRNRAWDIPTRRTVFEGRLSGPRGRQAFSERFAIHCRGLKCILIRRQRVEGRFRVYPGPDIICAVDR